MKQPRKGKKVETRFLVEVFTLSAAGAQERTALGAETRFELEVDGEPISLATDIETDGDVAVSKLEIANFPAGLEPGWHRFLGRWYDEGALVLSTDRTIQFIG